MKLSRILAISLVAGMTLALIETTFAAEPCDFQCTLNRHLEAIQARNFEAFAATITREATIDFILPNGRAFTSREEYLEVIKGWFMEDGWHFSPRLIRTIEGQDLAIALLQVSYDEDDRNGQPYHLDHFLTLGFQKQSGEWRLVLDQNTRIDP